ncbi:MAG TPA: hypothetical protein EYM70_03145 [Pelagibacteraceae bacterium]|nr:hypothetical protein [Pelagibacteraceae bacterium]
MSSDSSLSDNESHSEEDSDQDYNPHITNDHWLISTQREAANKKELINDLHLADNSEKIIKCIDIMKKKDLILVSKLIKAAGNCAFINQKTIKSKCKVKCLSKHRSKFNISINKGKKKEILRKQLIDLVNLNGGKYFILALKAFKYE